MLVSRQDGNKLYAVRKSSKACRAAMCSAFAVTVNDKTMTYSTLLGYDEPKRDLKPRFAGTAG
jgi:hypothetical protein